jgi:hypothetical protein
MKNCLFFAAAMFMLSSVQAADNQQSMVVEKPLVAQTLDAFNHESAGIREQMQPGGIYGLMKAADKSRVETRLGDMQKLLQDHAAEGGMSQADKIALVNAEEEVNGILRHNDYNRLVCERRAPVGTNIPKTTCRTFGEIEQARADSKKSMSDIDVMSRRTKSGN